MSSIQRLKRSRDELNSKLQSAINQSSKTGYEDPNIWKPTLDKEKETGYARIRFLPPPEGEELPFVKVIRNSCKSPAGKFFIENSRKTIGEPDPFNEFVSRIYSSDNKTDVDFFKKALEGRSAKNYYANVLVIDDPAKPENNGKVKIYQFGQKIMEMIQLKNKPQFADEKAANPFDMWEGADFIIKARVSDKNWTYDKSSWSDICELYPNDDTKKESVWAQTHSLASFLDPKNFKSYEELAQKLVDCLGTEVGSGVAVVTGGVAPRAASKPAPAARLPQRTQASVEAFDDDVPESLDRPSQPAPEVPERSAPRVLVATQTDDDFFKEFD